MRTLTKLAALSLGLLLAIPSSALGSHIYSTRAERTLELMLSKDGKTVKLPSGSGLDGVTANRLLKTDANGDFVDSLLSDDGTTVTLTSGQLLVPDGSVGAPGFAFAPDPDTGFFLDSIARLSVSVAGNERARWEGTESFRLAGSSFLGWPVVGPDLKLFRDAANTLAQRNGTAAQTFRLYKTFTDSANYERLALFSSGSQMHLFTEAAGTGVLPTLSIGIGAGSKLIFVAGNIGRPSDDNIFQLGTGANRFKSGFFGTELGIHSGTAFTASLVDGALKVGTNPATTGAVRLANGGSIVARNAANTADLQMFRLNSSNEGQLGGNGLNRWHIVDGAAVERFTFDNTTDMLVWGDVVASAPGIKRFGTTLQARFGDDSAFTTFEAGQLRANDFFVPVEKATVAADCDAAAEERRMIVDAGVLKICDQTGATTGWTAVVDFSS